jgi:hypothetical protein
MGFAIGEAFIGDMIAFLSFNADYGYSGWNNLRH